MCWHGLLTHLVVWAENKENASTQDTSHWFSNQTALKYQNKTFYKSCCIRNFFSNRKIKCQACDLISTMYRYLRFVCSMIFFFLSITASDLSERDKNPLVNFLPMINQVWMPMLGVYCKLPLTCHGELKIRLYLQHKACDSSSAVIQSLSPLQTLDMGIQLEVLLQVYSSWEHLLGLKPVNKIQRIKYI